VIGRSPRDEDIESIYHGALRNELTLINANKNNILTDLVRSRANLQWPSGAMMMPWVLAFRITYRTAAVLEAPQ